MRGKECIWPAPVIDAPSLRVLAASFVQNPAHDLVILCRCQREPEEALQELRSWTEQAGLRLHPEKTRIVDVGQEGAGIEFLGYHFLRTRRRLTRILGLTPGPEGRVSSRRTRATLTRWTSRI